MCVRETALKLSHNNVGVRCRGTLIGRWLEDVPEEATITRRPTGGVVSLPRSFSLSRSWETWGKDVSGAERSRGE